MIDGLAFIGSYRSPPEYRCAQRVAACLLGPALKFDWEGTCGTFSSVRAKKDLAACLEHVGLPDLARRSARMRVGDVEALIWDEMLAAGKDSPRWFDLERVRDVARRIRKPINDANDYKALAERVLAT